MKKLFLGFAVLLMTASFNSNLFAGGCTKCSSGSDECHRVLVGNTVHIFYGEASSCDDDQQ